MVLYIAMDFHCYWVWPCWTVHSITLLYADYINIIEYSKIYINFATLRKNWLSIYTAVTNTSPKRGDYGNIFPNERLIQSVVFIRWCVGDKWKCICLNFMNTRLTKNYGENAILMLHLRQWFNVYSTHSYNIYICEDWMFISQSHLNDSTTFSLHVFR